MLDAIKISTVILTWLFSSIVITKQAKLLTKNNLVVLESVTMLERITRKFLLYCSA